VGFALSTPTGLMLAAFLVLLNGFFVAAEFALVKVRSTQIDAFLHRRSGRMARHMVDHLDAYLSATQLGITLASLGLGWIGEPALAHLFEPVFRAVPISDTLARSFTLTAAFGLISVLHIVLGELAPKSLAIRKPEPTALWVALPLFFFYKVSFPAIWLLNKMANLILRLLGIEPVSEGDLAHGEEEIRRLLASPGESTLSDQKRELLDNIFELSERVARQVMVPRTDVVYLDAGADLETSLQLARDSGHTRFPLCNGDLDQILGIIHIKDVFRNPQTPAALTDIKRETFFVPETLPLERLMRRMRSSRVHMAPVLDEYGSVSGIVTFENVIEEIVGEIQDEFDAERPELLRNKDGTYRVLGSMLVADLEDELQLEIDTRDEDTIAGIALSAIGRSPEVGDRVQVGPIDLEVTEVDVNRIRSLTIRRADLTPTDT
jgi:CBS domain containing-hemolysin-like protein